MAKKNLLFEIGTEDLPSKNLRIFSEKIKKNIEENLKKNGINYSVIENYYTNIRLIFIVVSIDEEIIIEKKIVKGPPVEKCFDELGEPTKTALGFARKYQAELDDLSQKIIDNKEYFFYEKAQSIIKTKDILPNILERSLDNVEGQKKMRWGDSSILFIRPIRWMLLLLEDKHIETNILGVKTTNYTYGDKANSNNKIIINGIDKYFESLKKENIQIDQNKRRDIIKKNIATIVTDHQYDNRIDSELLDEVANMAEYPYVYKGHFPDRYLELPEEVLRYVIQDTQKYFMLYKDKKITNSFIGTSNVKINKNIVTGNERVINPRLDDARFFISKDLNNSIFEKKDLLKKVIFHKKLGSMFDKVQRISELSEHINNKSYRDKKLKHKEIAEVCKLDLISHMVVEIPSLQGYIGCYYAHKKGMHEDVANGIKEHYAPRNPEEEIPKGIDAQIVSIADKLDTIVGIFLINEKPTGTRDPLGIRRATNGLLRIMLKTNHRIDLADLINASYGIITKKFNILKDSENILPECNSFFKEKLFLIFKENYGFKDNVISSVIDNKNINPYDMMKKIEAIDSILENHEYDELFSNAKRVTNILKKSSGILSLNIKENLLRESSEIILYDTINNIKDELNSLLEEHSYLDYLQKLNILNACVKRFFEEVMINVDDQDIKLNRLSLLNITNNYYNNLANIAILGH